ncbi:MAG: peptidase M22 [Ruminococcaceae bacterium]|nr:peptidase M22 [Oscillospiraceae bacterium]
MSRNNVVIGIDTSNYTTSFAALNEEDGDVLFNIKRLLPVKNGECGLRQSDAVFAHIKNLPLVMQEAKEALSDKNIVAIGVSSKPRKLPNSYMPCFLTGVAVAESLSAACGAPLFEFSHQCGHIMAAIHSSRSEELLKKKFGSFHLSGGTTELLLTEFKNGDFSSEIVGGTKDINAGQLIDRVGVMLDLQFPCGAELEKLALNCDKKVKIPKINTNDCYINLSGVENLAKKVYADTNDKEYTAAYVFEYLGEAILKVSQNYIANYGEMPILYVGGVMSNKIIKEKISSRIDSYFAEPRLSSDNAVGIAALARNAYLFNR